MGAGVAKKSGGGGRRGRKRGSSAAMADINITPFVDVMLVLLIIFMVTAPMLTVGVPLELPKSAAASLPTEQEPPLTVSLTADGLVMIQTTEVPADQLITKLRAIAETDFGVNTSIEQVMRLMVPFLAAGMRAESGVSDPAMASAQLRPRTKTAPAAAKV